MFENIILSPIPINDMMVLFRQIVREEMALRVNLKDIIPNHDRPITKKELSKFLGITTQTIIRWRKKGKIPFF